MTKKIEVIVIENDSHVIHRSVSNVYEDANPYNVVIQTMVTELTDRAGLAVVRQAPARDKTPAEIQEVSKRKTEEEQAFAKARALAEGAELDTVKDAIARDFGDRKMPKAKPVSDEKFNIVQVPPIKMSDVLGK